MENIKLIAFYLPQFHPIPENNEWWGNGFTEWTNVVKAKPLFKGHYQPQLPADLGFYDLRLAEARQAQADMASQYGIYGFCFYHYWFRGKRLLELPLKKITESGNPGFPFCLCWANESWSRRWLGEEKELLMKQEYSDEDDLKHAEYLSSLFCDKRYITVNNRPLFIIYRPGDLPDPSKTIQIIKEISQKENRLEPFIVGSNSHLSSKEKILSYGFDAVLNFRPQLGALPNAFQDEFSWRRFLGNFTRYKLPDGKLKIYSYAEALEKMRSIEPPNFEKVIPVVFVGWDNTARRGEKGIIITGNSAELFKQEMIRTIKKINTSENNPNLLFINAWNEWAEGNHLEPDQKNGLSYLKSILALQTI